MLNYQRVRNVEMSKSMTPKHRKHLQMFLFVRSYHVFASAKRIFTISPPSTFAQALPYIFCAFWRCQTIQPLGACDIQMKTLTPRLSPGLSCRIRLRVFQGHAGHVVEICWDEVGIWGFLQRHPKIGIMSITLWQTNIAMESHHILNDFNG